MLAFSEGRSRVFLSFCLLLLCLHTIDGQSTDDLAKLVNGTLPNAAAFQASSTQVTQGDKQGFITSKPQSSGFKAALKSIVKLGLASSGRDGYLYVPAQYDPSKSSPMILAIHAAGKGGLDALQILIASANSSGILLLAPESRGATWDALPAAQGSFGPDVAFINAALAQTFQLYNVDATTLGIQGFSDGATYALGLGMINGELFRKVMANSPGGILADSAQGHPPVFMSAGLQDNIFPIQQAGNADACYLEQEGYTVTYVQFNGTHEVPPAIAADTIKWSSVCKVRLRPLKQPQIAASSRMVITHEQSFPHWSEVKAELKHVLEAKPGDPKGPFARVPSLGEDLIKAINEGIWWVSHMHLSGAFFGWDNVGLSGFSTYFKVAAVAARADAWMAIEFLNSRGARPEFGPISGVANDWSHEGQSDPLLAMSKALALAKVGLKLDNEAHKLACKLGDTNAEHFLECSSEEEAKKVACWSKYVTHLKLVSSDKHAIKNLDRELAFALEDYSAAAGLEATIPPKLQMGVNKRVVARQAQDVEGCIFEEPARHKTAYKRALA